MQSPHLKWAGGLALAIFWCVGLYNRLMRIRARGFDALGSVEKHLKAYAAAVQVHLEEGGVKRIADERRVDRIVGVKVDLRAIGDLGAGWQSGHPAQGHSIPHRSGPGHPAPCSRASRPANPPE